MSQDNVVKFFDAIRADEAVVRRLRAVAEKPDEFASLSAEVGRERGFIFEPSDVLQAADVLAKKYSGELPDEALEQVAGGGDPRRLASIFAGLLERHHLPTNPVPLT